MTGMTATTDFMRMIRNGTPFGFARYGSEVMSVIAGDEQHGLKRVLLNGLEHRQLGYWIGTPSNHVHAVLFNRLLSKRYRQVVDQDTLITSKFGRRLVEHMGEVETPLVWVSDWGVPHDVKADEHYHVTGWDQWEKVRRLTFPRGTLILIDAGPVGTCLAKHWFYRSPRCTVIDMKGVYVGPSSSAEVAQASPGDSQTSTR